MKITFSKTGTFTGAFLGDRYRSEYVFKTQSGLPIASVTCQNFKATIKYNDTIYTIEPVMGFLTIKKHIIFEDGVPIGQVRLWQWFHRLSIEFSNGKEFKLQIRYKSIWDRFSDKKDYWIELQFRDELVSYKLTKGIGFEKDSIGSSMEVSGQIETDVDNLPVVLFGIFLIEYIMGNEGT